MQSREIFSVYPGYDTKHLNILFSAKAKWFLIFQEVVHILTTLQGKLFGDSDFLKQACVNIFRRLP
jgi:hypothetical protein